MLLPTMAIDEHCFGTAVAAKVYRSIVLDYLITMYNTLLLEPESRPGDKPVKFQVALSPNGTAILKGLSGGWLVLFTISSTV